MTTENTPMEGLAAYLRSQAHGAMCADEEEQLRRWADEVEDLEQRAELAEQAHVAAAEELELLRAEREAASLPQGDARTPQDYAIEHAEYMAESAMRLVDAVLQEEFLGERDEQETSLLDAAAEETSEAIRSVRTSVYEFRKRRDRALAGRLAAPPSIPEGYVMVPKEPTPEMLEAALKTHEFGWCEPCADVMECGVIAEMGISQDAADAINDEGMKAHAECYRSMLAAAPQAAPPDSEANAGLELLEDLRTAYTCATNQKQGALLMRVLLWLGDGPTSAQLNEHACEWMPRPDYDALFRAYADVCADLALAKKAMDEASPQPQPAGVKEAPARMSGHRLWIDQHLYWWDTPSITGAQIKALASVDPTFGVWQQLEGPVDPRIHNDASVDLPGPTEKRFFTGKLTTTTASPVAPAAQPEPQWISVDERMPEPGTECIVWSPGNVQHGPFAFIDTWREQRECPVDFSTVSVPIGLGWDSSDFDEITHWMALPAAPSQEGEKK